MGARMGKRTAAGASVDRDRRPRYVRPGDIAEQLSISLRQAEALVAAGVFGPALRIGHRTVRVQQAGVDAYVRRLEREGGTSREA